MTELATRETATSMTLEDTMTLGKVLAQSGFFNDAKEASQAVVKVLAGRELGFGPIASMTGVHIVQGKPSLGANLLGAAIKNSGRYNYRVTHLGAKRAEIAFFENGEEVGRSEFTMDDANAAGLSGKQVWKQYPKNMLFARALSNGARWYCPDVFSGVTPYTPEELGAEVDGETGEIIDVTPVRAEQPAQPQHRQSQPTTRANGRPLPADAIRKIVRKKAGWGDTRDVGGEPVTEKQIGFVAMLLQEAVDTDGTAAEEINRRRHAVLEYLVGVDSTKKLQKSEASAIIDWLTQPDSGQLNEYASREAAAVVAAWLKDQGQLELPPA